MTANSWVTSLANCFYCTQLHLVVLSFFGCLCFLQITSLKLSDLNLTILSCLRFSTRPIGCVLPMLVRMISLLIPVYFSNVTATLSPSLSSSALGSVMPLTKRHQASRILSFTFKHVSQMTIDLLSYMNFPFQFRKFPFECVHPLQKFINYLMLLLNYCALVILASSCFFICGGSGF